MSQRKNSSSGEVMRFFIVLLAVCLVGAAIMLCVQLAYDGNTAATSGADTSTVLQSPTTPDATTVSPDTTVTPPTSTADTTVAPPVTTEPPQTSAPDTTKEDTTAPITEPPKPSYDLDAWYLTLVNPWNKLPAGYVDKITLVKVRSSIQIDSRIIDPLNKMLADCYAAHPTVSDKCSGKPLVCSGFRSQEKQESLFANKLAKVKKANPGISDEDAYALAATEVAIPGTSEHQLGLAVDIVCCVDHYNLDMQETKTRQRWLIDNCHKYGFILRYPADKMDITGIIYEPWHYRYVGVEVATDIMSRGICFEEWLAEQKG